MLTITADTIDELYKRTLHRIMVYGEETHPRGYTCREISPCCTILTNPSMNVLVNPLRKASKTFMAAELLWILMGRSDVEMIKFYNSKIEEFSDNGTSFFGAYGPKIMAQLPYVVTNLIKDPWSRQSVINIWRESPPQTKDVPCTVTMHFLRRPLDILQMIVYMRSQDIWLGFPYDVHNFTCIQMLVASMLGIKAGKFTLVQGSLHAYQHDYSMIQTAAKWTGNGAETFTPTPQCRSFKDLMIATGNVEKADIIIRTIPTAMNQAKDLIQQTSDQLFAQKLLWLYNHGAKKHAIS